MKKELNLRRRCASGHHDDDVHRVITKSPTKFWSFDPIPTFLVKEASYCRTWQLCGTSFFLMVICQLPSAVVLSLRISRSRRYIETSTDTKDRFLIWHSYWRSWNVLLISNSSTSCRQIAWCLVFSLHINIVTPPKQLFCAFCATCWTQWMVDVSLFGLSWPQHCFRLVERNILLR